MPCKETCPLDERVGFIAEYVAGEASMTALCRMCGISRKTGYKWVARYEGEGLAGLAERSRAPQALAAAVEQAILTARPLPPR